LHMEEIMKRLCLAALLILSGSAVFAQSYPTPAQTWQSQSQGQKFSAVYYLIAGYLASFAGSDQAKEYQATSDSYALLNEDSRTSIATAIAFGIDGYYGNPTHQYVPMFQAFASVWASVAPGFNLP